MTEENTITEERIKAVANQAENEPEKPLKYGQRQLLKRQAGGQSDPIQTEAPKGGRPDRSKPARVKFNDRNRISFDGQDPNFVYHGIVDRPGRIEKLQTFGYELVESDQQLGDYRVAEGSKMGRAVSKPCGGGQTMYLMRIPKEFYEEDQKEKAKRVDATEAGLKPNKSKDEYGPGLTDG